jgi:hypothetical protein
MQIPIRLKEGPFLLGVEEIISDHDNVARPISSTHPVRGGGTVNTYKMEVQEADVIADPVMRVWKTADGTVRYRVYRPDSAAGKSILKRLEEGLHTDPPQTMLTKPNDPEHSGWSRWV